MDVRKLEVADLAQARALGAEAFGGPPPGVTPPPLPTELPPGRHEFGTFDGDRLVARVVALELSSWWRGTAVPTTGIAGVAVAAEHRGAGLLGPLFEAMLAEAVGRGEVLSTLYPTANGIYRPFGYELVSSYDTVEVPTAELGRVAAPVRTTTRRAAASDVADAQQVYATWAAAQNGPLTRTGPRFSTPAADLLVDVDVTLAVDAAGATVGAMTWTREGGYGPDGVLVVHDLVALTGDAYRALWRVAGSFASVAGRVRLSTSGDDPARLVLPPMTWHVVDRHPYLLRVLDVVGAVTALAPTLAGGGRADVGVTVAGDRLGVLDGGYRIEVGDGATTVGRTPLDAGAPTLTPQGLALLVSGAQSCGNLRLVDHLTGPADHDVVLDALFAGPPRHVRDYF